MNTNTKNVIVSLDTLRRLVTSSKEERKEVYNYHRMSVDTGGVTIGEIVELEIYLGSLVERFEALTDENPRAADVYGPVVNHLKQALLELAM